MNLFHLSENFEENARYHVDRHVVKMPLEACQLLSNAHLIEVAPYRRSHVNHPCSIWVRESISNYLWTVNYAKSLCREYSHRYNGKTMKTEIVVDWLAANLPNNLPDIGPTRSPRCFGELKGVIVETDSVVEDYREYYRHAKSHLFQWRARNRPEWVDEVKSLENSSKLC